MGGMGLRMSGTLSRVQRIPGGLLVYFLRRRRRFLGRC